MRVHALQNSHESADILIHPANWTGGYLIDENGCEIAITEHMIEQACRELDRQWVSAPGAVSA